jgi:hypothetical protein
MYKRSDGYPEDVAEEIHNILFENEADLLSVEEARLARYHWDLCLERQLEIRGWEIHHAEMASAYYSFEVTRSETHDNVWILSYDGLDIEIHPAQDYDYDAVRDRRIEHEG